MMALPAECPPGQASSAAVPQVDARHMQRDRASDTKVGFTGTDGTPGIRGSMHGNRVSKQAPKRQKALLGFEM
jgi:hypothetical protein